MVIIDEAAYIKEELFYQVIVPILVVKNTVLLCLSSPEQDANYYSALLNFKKENGDPFFHVVECFQICKACRKLERIQQINCTHVKQASPWLSERNKRELRQLYRLRPADYLREFGGLVVSDYQPALPKMDVERLFTSPMHHTVTAPRFIFTSCDPNGGGPSQMSIASAYFDAITQEWVFIALDSESVADDHGEYLLLLRHYTRLYENKYYREAHHVFIPENNLGLESAHLNTMVSGMKQFQIETYYDKPNRAGVNKNGEVTRGYQLLMATVLTQGACAFDQDMFTVTRGHNSQSMRAMLEEQMLRYHWEKKAAPDAMGKDRYALTGKVGNKQDDLLIAVAMCMYWGRVYIKKQIASFYSPW